ncbi:MAG: DUF732 domain-containing protein [Corynebacterium sp.]|nr:DUF732 domain-containing protein [Corynebacterium sp.]
MNTTTANATRRGLSVAALVAVGSILAACGGGTTVESDTDESIAPLTRELASSSTSSTSAESSSAQESASTSSSTGASAEPQGPDQPAQEISQLPTTEFTSVDTEFLAALNETGIDVAGIESEMVSAGMMVCGDTTDALTQATVDAVAGQVIEQQRTTASHDTVVAEIKEQASKTYCS